MENEAKAFQNCLPVSCGPAAAHTVVKRLRNPRSLRIFFWPEEWEDMVWKSESSANPTACLRAPERDP